MPSYFLTTTYLQWLAYQDPGVTTAIRASRCPGKMRLLTDQSQLIRRWATVSAVTQSPRPSWRSPEGGVRQLLPRQSHDPQRKSINILNFQEAQLKESSLLPRNNVRSSMFRSFLERLEAPGPETRSSWEISWWAVWADVASTHPPCLSQPLFHAQTHALSPPQARMPLKHINPRAHASARAKHTHAFSHIS